MTHTRKNELFQEIFDSCLQLQFAKAKDYASDVDALSNFKSQDAEALGLTPYQKWGVYFAKQAMSILGAIGKNPKQPSTTSEPIEERINDAIIYLVLFKCLLEDLDIQTEKTFVNNTYNLFTDSNTPIIPKPKSEIITIEKDQENNCFKITFKDRREDVTLTNIMAYSETNPYFIVEFKPLRILNNKVAEYIVVAQRKWEKEQWKSYISMEELDLNDAWFIYNKNK